METEACFNVGLTGELGSDELDKLLWILGQGEGEGITRSSSLSENSIEVGPRLAFTTAFSANCQAICEACGIPQVHRLEKSRRYEIVLSEGAQADRNHLQSLADHLHDRRATSFPPHPSIWMRKGKNPSKRKVMCVVDGDGLG